MSSHSEGIIWQSEINCYGIISDDTYSHAEGNFTIAQSHTKEERCRKPGSHNGYCRQHVYQNRTCRSTCVALNSRGIRCVMSDYLNDKCRLHNTWRLDLTVYWSIVNDKEIVTLSALQHAEDYCEKHEKRHCFFHHQHKGHEAYLTKEVSLTKVDVLINLINEFIGRNYIWIAIGKRYKLLSIDVVGVDCKHKLEEASIYCVKIGKVYERSHLESQRIIT